MCTIVSENLFYTDTFPINLKYLLSLFFLIYSFRVFFCGQRKLKGLNKLISLNDFPRKFLCILLFGYLISKSKWWILNDHLRIINNAKVFNRKRNRQRILFFNVVNKLIFSLNHFPRKLLCISLSWRRIRFKLSLGDIPWRAFPISTTLPALCLKPNAISAT